MDSPLLFSRWLKRLRDELDMTQELLAEQVGCSVETIRSFESGRRRPSRAMTERLADVLHVLPAERAEFLRLARGGSERTSQQVDNGQQTLPPVPRDTTPVTISRRSARLPIPPTALIGREAEEAEVCRRLLDPACRLLTLVGAGGTGKTRLALQVATVLSEQFREGVAFVALAPIVAAEHVAGAVADVLDCPLIATHTPEESLLLWLRERELLLVLDNMEHLLEATPLLTAILREAPGVRVLATSRERLRLQGEWILELGGLTIPRDATRDEIERSDAVLLFLERARHVAGDFALTSANRVAVGQICRLLDGMPLGIELAASWVRLLEPAEIAVELTHSLDFLAGSDRDADPRHRSMRAVIDHSWALLSADEQGIMARLSVFRGGCRREAAEAVAGATLPMLAALLDKSLVRRATGGTPAGPGVPRYDLHEMVRQYAAEQLQIAGIAHVTARQHAEYYVLLSETATEQAHDGAGTALALLGEEQDNLRAALRWCAESDVNFALRLVVALYSFWEIRGLLPEAWATSTQVLSAAAASPPQAVDPRLHTRAIAATAGLALAQGRIDAALPLLEDGLQRCRALGDRRGTALALKGLGWVALEQGHLDRATRLFEESLALYEQVGNRLDVAWVLEHLGVLAVQQGNFILAATRFSDSLALAETFSDDMLRAFAREGLAQIALEQGDPDQALLHLEPSLRLFQALGHQAGIANCLVDYARVATEREQHMVAAQLLAAAATVYETLESTLAPFDQAEFQHTLERARNNLQAEAWDAAWREGQGLSLEQAARLASESASDDMRC